MPAVSALDRAGVLGQPSYKRPCLNKSGGELGIPDEFQHNYNYIEGPCLNNKTNN